MQTEQVLLAEHSRQWSRLQVKHWLSSRFRVKEVLHSKHFPVKLLHLLAAQLLGQEGTHSPSTALKPSTQVVHNPLTSQVVQLSIVQRMQLPSIRSKEAEQLRQDPVVEHSSQLLMVQATHSDSIRVNPVKHFEQRLTPEQTVQLGTSQERGSQVLLTSSKLSEQIEHTPSAAQVWQLATSQTMHEPFAALRLPVQSEQKLAAEQLAQLGTSQAMQVVFISVKPVWQSVQMSMLAHESALQLGSVQAGSQLLLTRTLLASHSAQTFRAEQEMHLSIAQRVQVEVAVARV